MAALKISGTIVTRYRRREYKMIAAIVVLAAILSLAWATIWNRQAEIKKLEAKAAKLEQRLQNRTRQLDAMRRSPVGFLLLHKRAASAFLSTTEPRWNRIIKAIWTSSQRWGLSPRYVAAMIDVESQFDPDAVGLHGEQGLMQVYSVAWPQFDTRRGFEIEYNVDYGCMIFSSCMKAARGNLREALRRYNGLGEIPEGVIPYADRVLSGRLLKGEK